MWPTRRRMRTTSAARAAGGEGAAFPQLRLVALAECATHAMFAAAMGPCTTGEPTFAKELVAAGALRPGMLCLADRGFTAYPLWSAAAASGAELLWRARGNALLPVLARHPDGSYASEIVAADDPHRERPLPVRVVEYALDDPGRSPDDTRYRLITTLADPDAAPAAELAALYAERWEIESVLDELKTHQRGPRVVLRSRTIEGVYQEAWGSAARTMPSGRSSPQRPTTGTSIPIACPSPGPSTPLGAACAKGPAEAPCSRGPCGGPSPRSSPACSRGAACVPQPGSSSAR